jgi:hypothetical protein
MMPFGLGAFILSGGLFAAYCWYAAKTPDPPAGHWLYSLGWMIHLLLIVLLALTVVGGGFFVFGFWQLLRIRRIEQSSPHDGASKTPPATDNLP